MDALAILPDQTAGGLQSRPGVAGVEAREGKPPGPGGVANTRDPARSAGGSAATRAPTSGTREQIGDALLTLQSSRIKPPWR